MSLPADLTRLVESERQLEAELGATRADAESVVRGARQRSEAAARRLEADIAEATVRLREQIEAEQITLLAEVQADARRRIERYAAAAARAGYFADLVVARLVAGDGP